MAPSSCVVAHLLHWSMGSSRRHTTRARGLTCRAPIPVHHPRLATGLGDRLHFRMGGVLPAVPDRATAGRLKSSESQSATQRPPGSAECPIWSGFASDIRLILLSRTRSGRQASGDHRAHGMRVNAHRADQPFSPTGRPGDLRMAGLRAPVGLRDSRRRRTTNDLPGTHHHHDAPAATRDRETVR